MDNMERLRLFLDDAEDTILEAMENFDYLFYFKHQSGLTYVQYILDRYSELAPDFHAISHIILAAISELEFIYNDILFNKLSYTWYYTDINTKFDSSYYLEQINILEKYRETVIEKELDICVMENKLGKGINNRERIDRLFIDLTIIDREIAFLNDTLYNVFNIE